MDELRECPFCGAKVEKHSDNYWYVDHLDSCWEKGRMFLMDKEQLDCWNTRATQPPCEYCNPVPGPWEFYKFCPHCGRALKGEPGTRQDWVDVKNPPEKSGSYWVWSNGHGKDAYFVKENNAWVGVHPRHRPTHWQPLPDAPKEAPPQINPADTLKDFGQAFDVLAKFDKWELYKTGRKNNKYICVLPQRNGFISTYGDTPQEAICLAAIEAKGGGDG